MFLSEWREFPSAPCLAGKKKLDDSSRLDVVEIARVPDMLPSLFSFLVGLRTYQHLGYSILAPHTFQTRSQTCEERQSASSYLSCLTIRQFVRMK